MSFTANVGPDLPTTGSVELTFDRLLMPASINRQTFQLQTLSGTVLTPNVAYDPVSRVVTVTPLPDNPFVTGQTYVLTIFPLQPGITAGQLGTGPGLIAIDGATLNPPQPVNITFLAGTLVTPPAPTPIDYCTTIAPIFVGHCNGLACHGSDSTAAQGLVLTTPAGVASTAVGLDGMEVVAVGANTGPRPVAESPGAIFGLDMPIIDPGPGAPAAGDPGDSWMMYKLLMAVPAPGDAGDIVPLSSTERATLASLVPGREMPFPPNPGASLNTVALQLTVAQLETMSTWIAQGAFVPPSCP